MCNRAITVSSFLFFRGQDIHSLNTGNILYNLFSGNSSQQNKTTTTTTTTTREKSSRRRKFGCDNEIYTIKWRQYRVKIHINVWFKQSLFTHRNHKLNKQQPQKLWYVYISVTYEWTNINICLNMPHWYNRHGWMSVKKTVVYLVWSCCRWFFMLFPYYSK